ncbi:MAG TPA: lipid-A-disaccharide synthase [Oscillatoriaceae cyanobacterium M33_DOE_052]|uniref:Lipid-A-disaccharide synthase n=1 Tax=Planktothricoides sp. SpSt-374 TaxID=2282167 RepID=A0A7C3VJW7_9CYAN|nr:lipid-A-disaccharide synthase [Oscillatoriaceae cyanobacterium M33_DOE_052]
MTNDKQQIDIVILSNGPGEVVTWVRPVVQQLRQHLGEDGNGAQVRISVVLCPCPHATGREGTIARSYPEVDRVQEPEHFWPFLLWGQTAANWDWRRKGAVIFLGGDQFFTAIIGKRLGYRTIVYAEWEARWQSLIDCFAVMKPALIPPGPAKYGDKFTVVGDLMAEVAAYEWQNRGISGELIGLLPGSKPAKLAQGVPLTLAVASLIHAQRPQTRFAIPLAPTLELQTLANFADESKNPLIAQLGGTGAKLIREQDNSYFLEISSGLRVQIWTETPAYGLLSQCRLCLTTVGANTAELGSLAVPMIVLLPTQQLDAMRAWDGIPGLLANLPLVGSGFAKTINWLVLRQKRLFAWPNIWANQEIVPELVGELSPDAVALLALELLAQPERLAAMRSSLRQLRGEPGAAAKIAQLVAKGL